jgi:hypothetical protein
MRHPVFDFQDLIPIGSIGVRYSLETLASQPDPGTPAGCRRPLPLDFDALLQAPAPILTDMFLVTPAPIQDGAAALGLVRFVPATRLRE